MRLVGTEKSVLSDEERWNAGIKASDLAKSLGVPTFRQRGVFRGSQAMFDQMDAMQIMQRQRWLNEHTA